MVFRHKDVVVVNSCRDNKSGVRRSCHSAKSRMSDERYLEVSEELVEKITADSLAKVRAAAHARECDKPEYVEVFDGTHCIDCEIEIPEARLAVGRVRCMDCQQHFEYINRKRR